MAPQFPGDQRLDELARRLRSLHVPGDPLVLPNVWDVASAQLVEAAGFPVVATSSSAIAATIGARDADSMGSVVALGVVRRIAAAVTTPVSADLESGYQLAPSELIRGLLEAGAVGLNLEDSDHHGHSERVAVGVQAAYVAGLRSAATKAGVPVLINARLDVWLQGDADPALRLVEGVSRARAYLEAGADCVFPIGLRDRDLIRAFVDQVAGPVNLLLEDGGPTLSEMRALGVARASLGSGLHRAAMREATSYLQRLRWPAPGTGGA